MLNISFKFQIGISQHPWFSSILGVTVGQYEQAVHVTEVLPGSTTSMSQVITQLSSISPNPSSSPPASSSALHGAPHSLL